MSTMKTKVVMLPSNEKAIRPLLVNPSTGRMEVPKHAHDHPASEYQKAGYKTFHLYFLSGEEIKEGDWVLVYCSLMGIEEARMVAGYYNEQFLFDDGSQIHMDYCRKIVPIDASFWGPQPSRSFVEKFIEEYNNSKQVD